MLLRAAVVSTVTLGFVMGTVSTAAAATPADSDLAASSPAQTIRSWMTGVRQLKVSFTGLPIADTTAVPTTG